MIAKRIETFWTKVLILSVLCCILTSCVEVRLNNAKRLIERPDFENARQHSPEWCRDALKTINELELEIERR